MTVAGEKTGFDGWPPGDWFLDPGSAADLAAYRREKVLVSGRTAFQEYEIFENRVWGKMLILDGRLQSAQRDEYIYHEALVHPALLATPSPRRVLVLGGGEGATLREVLRHREVERAVMVDLDPELVAVCRRWLPEFHRGAFDDPRAELVFADGRTWLASQEAGAFDVIILDLPEPLEEGPAQLLFTREMYALAQSRMAPAGVLAVQSGSGGPLGLLMPDVNATLRAVFPRVAAYTAFVPSFMDLYGFHLAGGPGFAWPTAERARARLGKGLRWLAPGLAAALPQLPGDLAARLREEGRVLSDAAPFRPRAGAGLGF